MSDPRRPAFSQRTGWNLTENEYARTLAALKSSGASIIDLTLSNPTECGFSYDLAAIRAALTDERILRYQPDSRGLLDARNAVRDYYQDHGVDVATTDIVLTAGTSEGYSYLFRLLCDAGDEILIPAPGYPLFDFLADLCDVKLVRYPLVYDHGWQIDFGGLAAATSEKTRAIIVVHPNNPTGHFTSDAGRAQLTGFCGRRGLALIVDEVFLDFGLPGAASRSFAGETSALTFVLSGISKICGLPQMKLAWMAVGGPDTVLREALSRLEVIADAYLSVGTPVQLAAKQLLGLAADFQSQLRERASANLRELDFQLSKAPGCRRLRCEAGWCAVLRLPALQTDEEFATRLLTEKSVAVHPGHFYDFAQAGHFVVSLIVPEAEFAEGIRRVFSCCA
jgi:aspartate/methionine/tyrosine aminotransferase